MKTKETAIKKQLKKRQGIKKAEKLEFDFKIKKDNNINKLTKLSDIQYPLNIREYTRF